VPHAIKMIEEMGKDGLVVLLPESQGCPADDILGFFVKKFPKNTNAAFKAVVMSGQGLSTSPSSGGLPNAALIGVDGTVLWVGNPNGAPKKIEELTADEIKKIKGGWGKSPDAKKARAQMYGKGNLAEAAKILAAAEQGVKPEHKEDFDAAKAELEVRYAARKKGVTALTEKARLTEAQKAALALQKDVKGKAEWETEVAALVDGFKTPEMDKELKADQALMKMIAGWADKAPADEAATALDKFAKKNEGTKAANRAKEFAAAAKFNPNAR
jgi:hypothetical protein